VTSIRVDDGQTGEGGERTPLRTHAEIVRLFDGFDLVEPGVSHHWNPDDEPAHELDALRSVWGHTGVGVKP